MSHSWGSDKASVCDGVWLTARGSWAGDTWASRGAREDVLEEMTSKLSVEKGQGSSQMTEGVKWTPDSQDSRVQ